jgi:predicted MPP superfamily phosphohydrolase
MALAVLGYLAVIMTGFYVNPSPVVSYLFVGLGLLFLFSSYLFTLTLLAHLLSLPLKKFPRKKVAWGTIAVAFLLVGWAYLQALSFTVTETTIEVKNLKAPVTLIHLPDLHLGPSRDIRYLTEVLAVVEEYRPDFVVYNGDLVDGNSALRAEVFDLFKAVGVPQYFTTGNHEYYVNVDAVVGFAQDAGVIPLRSERVEAFNLNLVGLEYMNADRNASSGHTVNDLYMDEELPKIALNPNLPTLLIHHSPVGIQYAVQAKVDVYLAGHTHGGQVFPGTALIKERFPYVKGRYGIDGLTLLVSQGAGTFGPKARLGTRNEIQVVRLTPAPSA